MENRAYLKISASGMSVGLAAEQRQKVAHGVSRGKRM